MRESLIHGKSQAQQGTGAAVATWLGLYLIFPPHTLSNIYGMSNSFLAKFSLGPCHASPSRDVCGRSRNPWSKSFLGKFSLGHCHAASPSKDVRGMP